MRVDSKEEAIQKVKDGEVLGALIIPERPRDEHPVSLEPGTVEVYYNAEDPAKRQFVENTIKAQVQSANAALTKRVAKEALKLLDLISTGGEYSFLGQSFDVLGLERAERILAQAQGRAPARLARARRARPGDRVRQAGAREPVVLRRRARRRGRARSA